MQKAIGDFLQEVRKEQGMTQKELADRINVSDKTISKWENGNSTPDTMILSSLCEALGITVNELLSCERLHPEEYSKKAEENIVTLLQENQKQRKTSAAMYVIGGALVLFSGLLSFGTLETNILYFIDLASLVLPAVMCAAVAFLCGKRDRKGIVKVVRATIIPSGVITSAMGFVSMLAHISDLNELGPKVAISLLTILYTTVGYIVLYIIEQHLD